MQDPYKEFESTTLPNGLSVHALHWPDRSWEAVGFLIHSGAEQDGLNLEGVAHFVEHMVSENAPVTKKEIWQFFDDCGGTVHLGRTGYHYTHYRFFVPNDERVLAEALKIFGTMLLKAKMERSLEQERQVITAEFNRSYPVKIKLDIGLRKKQMLYSDNFLGRYLVPLGDPQLVSRISQVDLQEYYDLHYTPANICIVGVGGLSLSALMKLISESPFSESKLGNRTPLVIPVEEVSQPLEKKHVVEISKYITFPVEVASYESITKLPGSTNAQLTRLFQGMLGEILNEEVREKRAWAYSIGASRHDFGHFHEFAINCGSFDLKAIDQIEQVIEDCISSLCDQEKMFERTKQYTLNALKMLDLTGQGVCEGVLDDLARYQRIVSLEEIGQTIELLTMNDLRAVLPWMKPERRWTLITRP